MKVASAPGYRVPTCCLPTATQRPTAVHATPVNESDWLPMSEVTPAFHALPFSSATTSALPVDRPNEYIPPTDMQYATVGQATPPSSPIWSENSVADQRPSVISSISGCSVIVSPDAEKFPPVAKHRLTVGHAMPDSEPVPGTGTRVQPEPVSCSTSGRLWCGPREPTAMQNDELGQAIAASMLSSDGSLFAEGTIFQPWPRFSSMRV